MLTYADVFSAYVTSNMSLRQNKEAEPQVLALCQQLVKLVKLVKHVSS